MGLRKVVLYRVLLLTPPSPAAITPELQRRALHAALGALIEKMLAVQQALIYRKTDARGE